MKNKESKKERGNNLVENKENNQNRFCYPCCICLLSVLTTVSFAYDEPSNSDYAYWNGSRTVKASRTTKSEIKWMQAALNTCISKGYISCNYLNLDGLFGPATSRATKAFQSRFGLKADGSFGPKTIAKMKYVLSYEDLLGLYLICY